MTFNQLLNWISQTPWSSTSWDWLTTLFRNTKSVLKYWNKLCKTSHFSVTSQTFTIILVWLMLELKSLKNPSFHFLNVLTEILEMSNTCTKGLKLI